MLPSGRSIFSAISRRMPSTKPSERWSSSSRGSCVSSAVNLSGQISRARRYSASSFSTPRSMRRPVRINVLPGRAIGFLPKCSRCYSAVEVSGPRGRHAMFHWRDQMIKLLHALGVGELPAWLEHAEPVLHVILILVLTWAGLHVANRAIRTLRRILEGRSKSADDRKRVQTLGRVFRYIA